jgi:hypothetical protein
VKVWKCLWGLESHCKGVVDGHFGLFQRTLMQAAQSSMIDSIASVVALQTAGFDSYRDEGHSLGRAIFVDYMPSCTRDKAESALLLPSSLPARVKSCHCWPATHVDERRQVRGQLLATDGCTITGIRLRAHILQSSAGVPAWRQSFPNLVVPGASASSSAAASSSSAAPAPVPEAEHDEDSDDDAGAATLLASELGCNTRDHDGWRCSYRTSQPEQQSYQRPRVLKRLGKKQQWMAECEHMLPEAGRHYVSQLGGAGAGEAKARAQARRAADRQVRDEAKEADAS